MQTYDRLVCLFSYSLAKARILFNAISAFITAFSHCLKGHTTVVLHVELVLLRHTNSYHMGKLIEAHL